MTHKLYLIEGIPSAGKTTAAKKLAEQLKSEGRDVSVYLEGDPQPADVSWQAFFTQSEYNEYKHKLLGLWENTEKTISRDELAARIDAYATRDQNNVLLAYTKIDFPEPVYWSIVSEAASHELCDGRSSLSVFTQTHLRRWSAFGKEFSGDAAIFECAFLQNHIFELMGVYEKSDAFIYEYMRNLLATVKNLNPMLIYIRPSSIEESIDYAAARRKSGDKSRPDWIDEIASWVENSNYGKHHGLSGKEGVYAFCRERYRLDMLMIEKLDIETKFIDRKV